MTKEVTQTARPLYEIADDILTTWDKPWFGAVPYLQAMAGLDKIACRVTCSEQDHYDEATRLRDEILAGAAELASRPVISQETIDEVARVGQQYPDGIHTCAELQVLEPGRRPCTCGTCPPLRRARVKVNRFGSPSARALEAYLPDNYRVINSMLGDDDPHHIIEGRDNAGWTLDGYVIPRLASGMIWAKEVEI